MHGTQQEHSIESNFFELVQVYAMTNDYSFPAAPRRAHTPQFNIIEDEYCVVQICNNK